MSMILLQELLDTDLVVDLSLFKVDNNQYKMVVMTRNNETISNEAPALDTVITRCYSDISVKLGRN